MKMIVSGWTQLVNTTSTIASVLQWVLAGINGKLSQIPLPIPVLRMHNNSIVNTRIHMHTPKPKHASEHTHMYTCACTHTHTYTNTRTHIHTHISASHLWRYRSRVTCKHALLLPKGRLHWCVRWRHLRDQLASATEDSAKSTSEADHALQKRRKMKEHLDWTVGETLLLQDQLGKATEDTNHARQERRKWKRHWITQLQKSFYLRMRSRNRRRRPKTSKCNLMRHCVDVYRRTTRLKYCSKDWKL